MAYQISYTDSVNKGTIIVEDATLNTETSLTFAGRGVTSYGQAVAENFLHLLENFANSDAPERPVEGQLWYDTSDGVNQLKVYDGTTWTASGGLKKSSSQPEVSNSTAGDLWVNTDSQQLYLFTGTGWVLVGPEFSDGLLTGAVSENITGSNDSVYTVLTIKIKNNPAIIIADTAFTPKTVIPGFRQGIKAGMNITSIPLVADTLKYYGVSEKAEALVIGDEVVPAINFLRANANSQTNFPILIKNNEGLTVGTGNQFKLGVENEAVVMQQNIVGSSIDFRLKTSSALPTVMRLDSEGFVGVNTTAPEVELDVKGNLKISPREGSPDTGVLNVANTTNSTSINSGAIITSGGAGIALDLNVGGNVDIGGILVSGNVTPDESGVRNIGTTNNKYNQVFANSFIGNVQGNVSGTVTGRAGSADRLASATTFTVTGDVENNSFEFDGQTGGTTKSFNVQIANSFIANKDVTFDAGNADELLLNVKTGETGVYRISKRNFLKTIPLVPAGAIMPFGGEEAPQGWLFCDGSEVQKSDYTELYNAIGFNFKDASLLSDAGVNTFALPDLRGRFALGLDNMGGPSANRVTNIAADAIGGNAGSETKNINVENLPEHEHDMEAPTGAQYYGLRVGSGEPTDEEAIPFTIDPGTGGTQAYPASGGVKTTGDLAQPLDTMNPYLAVNYIIYTGQ
jgi:microcystin-dependent protein